MNEMQMRPVHGLITQRSPGVGKVFYVHNGGNAGNEGTDPEFPLSTIALALAKVRANKNDYVFVLDHWTEAGPISVMKEACHIIGTGPDHALRTVLQAATDVAIFRLGSSATYAEIAGFNLGGGNAAPGIDIANCSAPWIHHCDFGHPYTGDTPLYGIQATGANSPEISIEDCKFYGDGKSDGAITSNGIRLELGADVSFANSIIRRNLFSGLVGADSAGAIAIDGALGIWILDNLFHVVDDIDGCGINILADSLNLVVDGNRAFHGRSNVENTFNPFRDLNAVDDNGWGSNYYNGILREPMTV